MKRREVLRASGATLAVALAGCAGENSHRKMDTTTETGLTNTDTTATTEETTTADATTTIGPAKTKYNLGTVHTHDHWRIAVTDFGLKATFETDDGETYEMPDGKQLGITTVKVTNQSSEEQVWAGMPFAAIFRGKSYEDKQGFQHPKFNGYVVMDDLRTIGHGYQYGPEAYPTDAGETVMLWALFVLPADATRERVTVGFDSTTGDGVTYPVRWVLN